MKSKAIDVNILENFELEITFDNNKKRIFDVKPYFKFKVFKELQEDNKNLIL